MLLLKAERELAVSPAHASYAKKLQITPLFIGPVHSYPDTFESATLSFRDGQSVHTYPVYPHRFESALQGGKFWIRYMNLDTHGQ